MAEMYNMYRGSPFESGTSFFSSREAAVNSWCAWYMSRGLAPLTSCTSVGGNKYSYTWYGTVNIDSLYESKKLSCSANAQVTPDLQSCQCSSGYEEKTSGGVTTCEQVEKCKAGPVAGSESLMFWFDKEPPGGYFCENGCTTRLTTTAPSSTRPGKIVGWGPTLLTGAECNPSSEPPEERDPEPTEPDEPRRCPTGQCPGEINGVYVCKPCSSTTTPTTENNTTSKDNGDGTRTETTTNTERNTTCSGDKCTTTTTTTTTNRTISNGTASSGPGSQPAGTVVSGPTTTTQTQTEEKPKPDFCKDNPKSPICKAEETSSFGGGCGSGFQCEGDAIQCAIARDQLQRHCQLFERQNTVLEQLFDAEGFKSGNQTLNLPGNQSVNVGNLINSADTIIGGGGACPDDLTIDVMDRAFVLEFSRLCGTLTIMGHVFVVVCSVVGALIVFRRRI